MSLSKAQILARMSEQERQKFFDNLTPAQSKALRYFWPFWARPEQRIPPGDWRTWLVLAGRGWG